MALKDVATAMQRAEAALRARLASCAATTIAMAAAAKGIELTH
jgi:hypothetical protein